MHIWLDGRSGCWSVACKGPQIAVAASKSSSRYTKIPHGMSNTMCATINPRPYNRIHTSRVLLPSSHVTISSMPFPSNLAPPTPPPSPHLAPCRPQHYHSLPRSRPLLITITLSPSPPASALGVLSAWVQREQPASTSHMHLLRDGSRGRRCVR